MNFEKALKEIIRGFKKNNVSYGLIGGFALGLYNVVRSTNDLDFLIDKKHSVFLKNFMQKKAYELIYESENVVQFEHPIGVFGSIDFLYAFRKPSIEMLNRVTMLKVLDGKLELNVLKPEDIIGLKVQAFINRPERRSLEIEDIKRLAQTQRSIMDWEIVKTHFELFNQNALFDELRNEYEKTKTNEK